MTKKPRGAEAPPRKKGQPPPVDKLLIPAIIAALAMLAYQFFKGIASEIPRVNVEDELEIREVFFGEGATGNSYAVLCHAEESKIPISSVFQDASNDGSAPAHFRVIDCNHVLPSSGKSIADRFGIDLKQRPSIFLSGKVGEPRQIPTKFLKTGAMLVRYLKGKLEPHAAKIETTQDLRAKCLDKEICALLLKGSNKKPPSYLKDAMQKLLVEFPTVAFASIDASALYVYNLEEYLPELRNEQPRFVVFKKVSGTIEKGGDRLITSYATLPSGSGVSYGPMSNLVAGVIRNTTPTEKIPVLPTIKTRTKKLEREEAAKRERKANRGPATTPPGMFSENDGSREGRRAERDRRRTEHRKNQNVREKTPEEIAEMERQRRQRMAEEAARWNMAPDDAPPTGEPMPADSYMFDDEEEERTTIVEEVDETLTDDEDVMDLD